MNNDFNLDAFDLNLLKAMLAIYEERQITAAADRLGITQPGLSHALARLRMIFADELFIRSQGGMTPTALAEDLYARIYPGLKQLQDSMVSTTALRPETLERTFTLGMNDYGASVILPKLIGLIAKVAPGVRLKTRHYAHGSQYDDLRAGNIDLSITIDSDRPGWTNAEVLFREDARVVAAADNRSIKGRLTLKQYVAFPHVIMAANGSSKSWIDDHLADLGLTRTVQHAVPHFFAIPPIIRGTSMISTLPGRIAKTLEHDNKLVTYPLPFAAPPHSIIQLWPKRLNRDPLNKWLRARVAESVA